MKHHTHKDTTVHTQSICLLPYTASTHLPRIRTSGTLAFPLIFIPLQDFYIHQINCIQYRYFLSMYYIFIGFQNKFVKKKIKKINVFFWLHSICKSIMQFLFCSWMYQIEITTKYKILINKCVIIKIFILFPHKFKLSQNHIKMQEAHKQL